MVSVGGSAVHESRRGLPSPSTHADTERVRVTKETQKQRIRISVVKETKKARKRERMKGHLLSTSVGLLSLT